MTLDWMRPLNRHVEDRAGRRLGRRVVFLFQLECHCFDVFIEIHGPSAVDSPANQHPKTFASTHVAQEGANACSGLKPV